MATYRVQTLLVVFVILHFAAVADAQACIPSSIPHCNAEPDNNECTCGNCDQNRKTDLYLESLPAGSAESLCNVEPDKCTTDVPPKLKAYQCVNYHPRDCVEKSKDLVFFPGEAITDYFDCVKLTCSKCIYSQGCETHPPSGCMYATGTNPEDYYDQWKFDKNALATDMAEMEELCGSTKDPAQGYFNEQYLLVAFPEAITKCTCVDCFKTITDTPNRGDDGGFVEYCSLNICDEAGEAWIVSGGQIKTAAETPPPPPAGWVTLKNLQGSLGVSIEVLAVVVGLAVLIICLCLFTICTHKDDISNRPTHRHHKHHHREASSDDDEEEEEEQGHHRRRKHGHHNHHKEEEEEEEKEEDEEGQHRKHHHHDSKTEVGGGDGEP